MRLILAYLRSVSVYIYVNYSPTTVRLSSWPFTYRIQVYPNAREVILENIILNPSMSRNEVGRHQNTTKHCSNENTNDYSYYRPVSTICVKYKIVEHIICKHIVSHIEDHNFMFYLQQYFGKGIHVRHGYFSARVSIHWKDGLRNHHCPPQMVLRPSQVYIGNTYINKTVSS